MMDHIVMQLSIIHASEYHLCSLGFITEQRWDNFGSELEQTVFQKKSENIL